MPPASMADRKTQRLKGPRVACEACHRRKRLCDVARNGFPCTSCCVDESHCDLTPGREKSHVPREPLLHSDNNEVAKSLPLFVAATMHTNLDRFNRAEDSIACHKSAVSAVSADGSSGNGLPHHVSHRSYF